MKKYVIATLMLFCITTGLFAQGIVFETGTWNDVLAKAKKENKMIFVDAYTTWCGPCKWMAKNIFPNDTVGKVFNKDFINYKFDMEKGEGVDFAKKHTVIFYPTFLFFNSNGEMVHRTGGSKQTAEFIADAKDALDPEKRLSTMTARFEKGERSPQFLKSYGQSLLKAMLPASKFMEVYIQEMPEKELLKDDSFDLITSLSEYNSAGFNWICKNRLKLYETQSQEFVNGYILSELRNAANRAGREKDQQKFNEIREKLEMIEAKEDEKLLVQYSFYVGAAEYDKAVEVADKYVELSNDANSINGMAWEVFEHLDKKEHSEKALTWAKKSVELEKLYSNTDTYANLLFKLGYIPEAKQWAEESIKLGKKEEQDTKETEALLKKIQAAEGK